jgi:hypothetical protein
MCASVLCMSLEMLVTDQFIIVLHIAYAGCDVVFEDFLLTSVLVSSLLCTVGYCNYFLIYNHV